jgi:catechol 2,3-dioxygenase-like lactoylglutathione lyase family enzyme
MERPGTTNGLRHVALFVDKFAETEDFYIRLMGMQVEWRPDADNVYLTSGNDNLALHKVNVAKKTGKLDHIGFFINDLEAVDQWYAFLGSNNVQLLTEPRLHRDGARSFYCEDPAGTRVQIIYHPPIADAERQGSSL